MHPLILILVLTIVLVVGTGFASLHLQQGSDNTLTRVSSDVVLSNEQIQLLYTDEAVGVGSYANDSVEPRGWELYPSFYWDANRNSIFEENEAIATTLFPVVHFMDNGQNHRFCPLHQSILCQPGDADLLFSGWISAPNVYASEVVDQGNRIAVNSTVSIYGGNNYVVQNLTITSLAPITLTDVSLIIYVGVDINGFFDDYTLVDTVTPNILLTKEHVH